MLTMYLCSKGSKETIIWTSNQVLIPSSLGALVIGWNSMLAILMLLLPKLLNNSTCSVYWADQALRLKTVTICISLIGSALEYCCAVWHHILTSYHSEEVEYIQKCTLKIIKPAPSCRCMKCLKNTQIGWKAKWTLSRYHQKDTKRETHSPNISLRWGCLHTITKQRTIQHQFIQLKDYIICFFQVQFYLLKNSLVRFNYNFIFIFISSLMEHCNSCICKNVDIKHYYYYYYYHYIMDTGLKLGRGSLITIV